MSLSNGHISTKKFLFLLFLAVFLESAGYLAFPFLTLRLRDQFGLSAEVTGIVLLTAFWIRPLASLVVGQISSKVSASSLSVLSCLFEAIAFYGLAMGTHVYIGVASIILGNIGLALWRPGLFATIYNDKTHPNRNQRISLLNGALNAGIVVGCLGGAYLTKFSMEFAFLLSASMYAVLTIPIFFLMKPSKEKNTVSTKQETEERINIQELILISVLTISAWATLGQFTVYVGLLANDYLNDSSYTGVAFSLAGLTIVIVSFWLSRLHKLETKFLTISIVSVTSAICGWFFLLSDLSFLFSLNAFVILLSIFEATVVVIIADKWNVLGPVKGQSYNYTVRCLGQGLGGFIGGQLYVKSGVAKDLAPWVSMNWVLLLIFLISMVVLERLRSKKLGQAMV